MKVNLVVVFAFDHSSSGPNSTTTRQSARGCDFHMQLQIYFLFEKIRADSEESVDRMCL
jgi:hypothetical protein